MKNKTNIRQRGIFLRTVSIILLSSFVIILIFFYCYQILLLPKYENGIMSEAELSCQMIENNFESNIINTINQLDYSLYNETDVYNRLYEENPSRLTLRQAFDLIIFLRTKVKENPSLYAIELYFSKSDQIVSTKHGLSDSATDHSSQQKILLAPYETPVMSSSQKQEDYMSFSHPITLTTESENLGGIIYYVYTKKALTDILQISEEQMPVFLMDPIGEYLAFSDNPHLASSFADSRIKSLLKEKRIELKNQTFSSCSYQGKSSFEVFRWVSLQSITNASYEINRIFWTSFCLLLGLALILALISTYLLYNPWQQLLLQVCHQKLHVQNNPKNEYYQVVSVFQSLTMKLNRLEEFVQESRMIATNNFFLELLKGRLRDENELAHQLEVCELSFPYQYYQVADIHFVSSHLPSLTPLEFQFLKASLIRHFQNCQDNSLHLYPVETNEYTISIVIHTDTLDIETRFQNILSTFPDTEYLFPQIMHCALGNAKTQIFSVSESKHEAECAFEWYYLYPDMPFFFYSEEQPTSFPYPADKWDDWKSDVRKNNVESLLATLKTAELFLKENHYPPKQSQEILERMLDEFIHCLKTLHTQNNFPFEGRSIDKIDTASQLLQVAEGLLRQWKTQCETTQQRKASSNIEVALQYIDAHLEQHLGLSEVANQIHISPSYLSKLFKEQLNEKFNDYIYRKKMEYAAKLLTETETSVDNISESLGFSSSNYFIRRFKKYYGITPSIFRDNHRS